MWIIGESRTGKTAWARSLGNHIYWNAMFSLDVWKDNADYLVIDDIEWQYIPCKKAIFGGQAEFIATDKYKKKRRIKWGKPTILLANPDQDPMAELSVSEKKFYEKNVIYIQLFSNKLY